MHLRPGRIRPACLIAMAWLLVQGCSGGGSTEETSALSRQIQALEEELAAHESALRHRRLAFSSLDRRRPAPTRDAPGLQSQDNRLTPEVLSRARADCSQGSGDCDPVAVMTVLAEAGETCPELKAQIGGLAQSCVTACDDEARYQEAVACARMTCHEFCTGKGCAGGVYAPPDECSDSDCFPDPELCVTDCPLIDACFFQVDAFNCECFSL